MNSQIELYVRKEENSFTFLKRFSIVPAFPAFLQLQNLLILFEFPTVSTEQCPKFPVIVWAVSILCDHACSRRISRKFQKTCERKKIISI